MSRASVVVFSDSHGREAHIRTMMQKVLACGDRPTHVLFLGDGLVDLAHVTEFEGQSVLAVRGNCDLFAGDEPEIRTVGLGPYRLLMMHGHTAGVKYSLTNAVALAVRENVDALLYGHTHEPLERALAAEESFEGIRVNKPLLIFCPGALKDGSFGRVFVTEQGLLASHGNLFG